MADIINFRREAEETNKIVWTGPWKVGLFGRRNSQFNTLHKYGASDVIIMRNGKEFVGSRKILM